MDKNKSVIVIGAGIAGLQAAIELADCGIDVKLIEKKTEERNIKINEEKARKKLIKVKKKKPWYWPF